MTRVEGEDTRLKHWLAGLHCKTLYYFSVRKGFVECQSGRDVLIQSLRSLAEYAPGFLEQFAARPKHGRKRRYLAQSIEELYSDRPDLAHGHSCELLPGWYMGTNVSHEGIKKIIKRVLPF